ncbi:hypothetical protein ABPG75_002164 [Micractinium tetrahymenae]
MGDLAAPTPAKYSYQTHHGAFATMPAIWAGLIGATMALLQRFEAGLSADQHGAFVETVEWQSLLQTCCESGQQASAAERTQLLRLLRKLGGAVAAWDAPLQQQLLPGPAALVPRLPSEAARPAALFAAAGSAGVGVVQLADSLAAGGETALDICRPVALALGSGRLLASHVLEARRLHTASFPDLDTHTFSVSLGGLLALQVSFVRLSLGLAMEGGALRMVAQRLLPPCKLLAWLQALAAALHHAPLRTEDDMLGLPLGFDNLLNTVYTAEAFRHHSQLLQGDEALSSSLAGLLLPALARAAVAQRLPADRQPRGFSWATPSVLAGLLSLKLLPALLQYLDASDNAAVLRLFRSAAAVVAAGRPSEADPAAVLRSHADAAALLGLVTECAAEWQARQQTASGLLAVPLLRQLGSALQAAQACRSAGSDCGQAVRDLCCGWAAVLGSLERCLPRMALEEAVHAGLAGAPATPSGAPSNSQWCAAAVEALRALPQLALAADGMNDAQEEAQVAVQALASSALRLASGGAAVCAQQMNAQEVVCGLERLGSTAQHSTAAAQPFPELLEAACRLVRWSARPPAAMPQLLPAARLLELQPLLTSAFDAALPCEGSPAAQPEAASRTVQGAAAAAAAYWEAFHAIAAASSIEHLSAEASFDCAVTVDDRRRSCQQAAQLLRIACKAPRLAAQLLAADTLHALVGSLAGRDPTAWRPLVKAARDAMLVIKQAASGAVEIEAGSTGSSALIQELQAASHRFRHAALVCKRWRELCLSPVLLHCVVVRAVSAPLPRYRALLSFLAAHAQHVRQLELRSYSHTDEEAVAAAVTSCLAACGTAGALQDLQVGLWTPQSSTDSWLPSLTSLRRLRLGTVARPLQLPHGISRLQALRDAELTGCPLELGYVRLPPSLTGLCLRDMASTALPHQLSQLTQLHSLELDGTRFARDGLGPLAACTALHTLVLPMRPRLSLEGLDQLTWLQRLVCTPVEGPGFDEALGRLQSLTSLALGGGELTRFPPTLAVLPRLQRFWCASVGKAGAAGEHEVALPRGPYLQSLRWLGLRWGALQAAPAVLRDAPQLEYLSCLDAPRLLDAGSDGEGGSDSESSSDDGEGSEGSGSGSEAGSSGLYGGSSGAGASVAGEAEKQQSEALQAWRSFWAFVSSHPPLRCLGLDSNEHASGELLDALIDLAHARRELQVRRTSRRGGCTFLEELLQREAIPRGPG